MKKSTGFLLLIIVGSLVLSACGGSQPPATTESSSSGSTTGETPAQAENVAPTTAALTEPIAAVVNDETIPLTALERAVERRLAGIRAIGDAMPSDMTALRLTELDALIQQKVIEQAATIQGINVTDADIDAEIQANINIAGGRDKWLAQLQAENINEVDYRTELRSALITLQMRDIVTKNACVAVEQVHARHILVRDEATAQEVKTKLASGVDFAQLAAEYSLDVSTKQTGGDLGWFARGQLLQVSVEDAAFSLEVNATSEPIRSELGYHIVQTLEKVKDRPVAGESCVRLSQIAFERWIQDLILKSKIEKYPNGKS
ncbi:MAG: peptidylprolyl isomerase [Anaerolineae bacterium]|nr:peptidylprolyl isomerase [Anaerolineae bacterium]